MTRIGIKDGPFLNTTYSTLSKGDGAEHDLILLRTHVTSAAVIGLKFILTSGGGGVGIQDGWTNSYGLYHTPLKINCRLTVALRFCAKVADGVGYNESS